MLVKETYNNVICQWNEIGTYLIDRVLEFRKQKNSIYSYRLLIEWNLIIYLKFIILFYFSLPQIIADTSGAPVVSNCPAENLRADPCEDAPGIDR